MELQVQLNGTWKTADIVFAGRTDLKFLHEWQSSVVDDRHPTRRAAVELAEVAVHRYQAHSQIDSYARNLEEIGHYIEQNPRGEVASFVLLKCDWFPPSEIIGFLHFRRTWCNNLVLDYLSSHPLIAYKWPSDFQYKVQGAGTALLYFLGKVADQFRCDTIWGEATQGSRGFYQWAWKLSEVNDLILAPRENVMVLVNQFDSERSKGTDNESAFFSQGVYAVEEANPPFIGSRTAVSNPTRRLAYRFMDLPTYVQQEIVENLGLIKGEDQALPNGDKWKQLAFQRAVREEKLAELWRQVERYDPEGELGQNPFEAT